MPVLVRIARAVLVCAMLAGAVSTARADVATQTFSLRIPRQPLNAALLDLARQTGLQVALFNDTIDGSVLVGPVDGEYSPGQALAKLLAVTGLQFRWVN